MKAFLSTTDPHKNPGRAFIFDILEDVSEKISGDKSFIKSLSFRSICLTETRTILRRKGIFPKKTTISFHQF